MFHYAQNLQGFPSITAALCVRLLHLIRLNSNITSKSQNSRVKGQFPERNRSKFTNQRLHTQTYAWGHFDCKLSKWWSEQSVWGELCLDHAAPSAARGKRFSLLCIIKKHKRRVVRRRKRARNRANKVFFFSWCSWLQPQQSLQNFNMMLWMNDETFKFGVFAKLHKQRLQAKVM